jgi:hypothetical protein
MGKDNFVEAAKLYRDKPEFLESPKELLTSEAVEEAAEEGYTELRREDTLERMENDNLKLVIPADNQLQIDIDSEADYQRYLRALKSFQSNHIDVIKKIVEKPSKSGLPRRHITITTWSTNTPRDRVFYQALLGSDLVREINNLRRINNNDIFPIAFFEPTNEQEESRIIAMEVPTEEHPYCNFCTDKIDRTQKYYEIRSSRKEKSLVVALCEKCAAELGRKFHD